MEVDKFRHFMIVNFVVFNKDVEALRDFGKVLFSSFFNATGW